MTPQPTFPPRPLLLLPVALLAQVATAVWTSGEGAVFVLAVASAVLTGAAALAVRRHSRASDRLVALVEDMASGDLTARLDGKDVPLAAAIATVGDLTRSAMRDVIDSASSLNGTAEAVATATERMGTAFDETSGQAAAVSQAAGTVSSNVAAISSGAREMRDSITEIAKNVHEALAVSEEAVAMAADARTVMTDLEAASEQIGTVVRLITAIAEQTNLLALNATIEAARAGEAGKGFAVVASEVKDLAQETARATNDIVEQVQALQQGSRAAMVTLERTQNVVSRFSDFQTTISTAVEEQTATTTEISRRLGEVADSSTEIADTVGAVAAAVSDALEQLAGTRQAARELASLSGDLGSIAGRFQLPDPEIVLHQPGPAGGVVLEVEGVVTVSHLPHLAAVCVRWLRYEDLVVKPALGKQLELIKTHGLTTVIVDSQDAVGAYSAETNRWIGQEFVPQMQDTAVEAFVTVVPRSAVADLANKGWQESSGSTDGFSMVEVATMAEAEEIARRVCRAGA